MIPPNPPGMSRASVAHFSSVVDQKTPFGSDSRAAVGTVKAGASVGQFSSRFVCFVCEWTHAAVTMVMPTQSARLRRFLLTDDSRGRVASAGVLADAANLVSSVGQDNSILQRRPTNPGRRRSESNRRIEVLQTSALPLGYGARASKVTKTPGVLNPSLLRARTVVTESSGSIVLSRLRIQRGNDLFGCGTCKSHNRTLARAAPIAISSKTAS